MEDPSVRCREQDVKAAIVYLDVFKAWTLAE